MKINWKELIVPHRDIVESTLEIDTEKEIFILGIFKKNSMLFRRLIYNIHVLKLAEAFALKFQVCLNF